MDAYRRGPNGKQAADYWLT
ncbi:hypothetical protein AZE42_13774 [Rhizopogon vesiculosus]|uniref:Uncharacterized protein n=1 Tax=Rhizopogon vesiculosus TaxID=180088 RepID=A0A1J8PT58_9AGAM|nr:hypothetical protein AZE42_13774 [Rhizopogon vesiculosus]